MSIKNLSVIAANNNAAPPNGAPEGATLLKDVNDIMRQTLAEIRTLAASDTIASATTTDLGSKDATFLTVSGTTTITGLGTVSAGIYKAVTFSGALTLTHNATSLILPGAANIVTVAGDTAIFLSLGTGYWKCMSYQRAAVAPYGSSIPIEATTGITVFTNSWGTGALLLACWKDPFGVVHMVGNITGGTIGAAAFTLPAGYRPTGYLLFPWQSETAAQGGDIVIETSGVVTPRGSYTAGYIPLSHITFRTT